MVGKLHQVIIFIEHNDQEKILPANTQEELAASCLLILRERFNNPAWGYKPVNDTHTAEEKDFLDFWETDSNHLPALLYRQGKRLYDRLIENAKEDTDPDWVWYRNVAQLLELPEDRAVGYKVPYSGRYIPTAYYLLLKRRHYTAENFILAETYVAQPS